MAAAIHNFNSLPQFINEGTAELVHGIDDERGYRIWELAGAAANPSRLSDALDLSDTSTGNNDAYSAGYLFLRYFAKQAALDTANSIALGDATVKVELSGINESYFANLNSANIETAVTTASDSNFSIGTALNRSYSVAAGITQQIFTTNDDWTIRDIGSNNTLVAGNGNDYVTLTGSANAVSLGNGDNRVSLAGSANSISSADGNDSIRIAGADNSISTGAGNDSVVFAAYSNASVNPYNFVDTGAGSDYVVIYNDFQTVSAGEDNDTVHIRGNFNSVSGGAGNDDLSIYTAFNTVSGGAGQDRFIMQSSNIPAVTITDFSIDDKDYIYLTSSVRSAYYDSIDDAVVLGNIRLYLDNADNINDFLNMSIYNQSAMTKLSSLMGSKVFDWNSNGDYYFLIENGSVNIADNALAYDGSLLQPDKHYALVSLNGNNISVSGTADAAVSIVPHDSSNYFLTLDDRSFTFAGNALFDNDYALRGNFTVDDSFSFIDDDIFKLLSYKGDSNINVILDDSDSIALKADEAVFISFDSSAVNYIASSDSITKEVIAVSDVSSDVTTFRGYNFRFGSNVLAADFSELNHYSISDSSITLFSGTVDIAGFSITIESSDRGVTFAFDSDSHSISGIISFTDGDRITVNRLTYSFFDGKNFY